jgi:Uma2 family endonuclease
MTTTVALLTAEEYAKLPEGDGPTELVRGQVVEMNRPGYQHGKICVRIARYLGDFAEKQNCGTVVGNDAGVITRRNPDSVRGPDVSYYSYLRLPRETVPKGYPSVAPELVVEVLSPDDRWSDVHAKTAEYLEAGVVVVCVIDPRTESVQLYYANQPPRTLSKGNALTLPEVLGDFQAPVARLFD